MSENPQNSPSNIAPRHGAFLMIFAFVADDHDLDDSAKILYGRLTALAEREGYCYASDKYLCELCNQEIRSLQRRLQQLEEKGYIRRETLKKGVLWERKIFITNLTNSKNVYEASPMTSRSVTGDVSNSHQWRNNKIRENIDKKEDIEKDFSKEKSKKADKPPLSEPAFGLASHLLKKIKEHSPNFKQPNLDSWAIEVDRMIRLDNRKPDEIQEVIDWATEDGFWHKNILSASKLRQKFDALILGLKETATTKMIKKTPVTDEKVQVVLALNLSEQYQSDSYEIIIDKTGLHIVSKDNSLPGDSVSYGYDFERRALGSLAQKGFKRKGG